MGPLKGGFTQVIFLALFLNPHLAFFPQNFFFRGAFQEKTFKQRASLFFFFYPPFGG